MQRRQQRALQNSREQQPLILYSFPLVLSYWRLSSTLSFIIELSFWSRAISMAAVSVSFGLQVPLRSPAAASCAYLCVGPRHIRLHNGTKRCIRHPASIKRQRKTSFQSAASTMWMGCTAPTVIGSRKKHVFEVLSLAFTRSSVHPTASCAYLVYGRQAASSQNAFRNAHLMQVANH